MKFRFFLLMLLPICMVGCNDEMDSLVKGPSEVAESINPDVRKPLCIRLDGFDENKMAFYADPKSNMRYIYDSSKKIAFAYNEDEEYGDYVLDYYGIRDWVESLPKRSTSMMILQNYTIIGL